MKNTSTFPHVHLAVRPMGRVVDPFTGISPGEKPCGQAGVSFWQPSVLKAFPYAGEQPFVPGFTDHPVNESSLMRWGILKVPSSRRAQALVFYGMALNLEKGDQLRIVVASPDGELVREKTKTLKRHKATYLFFTDKKRRNNLWPAEIYYGSFSLLRDNRIIWSKRKNWFFHSFYEAKWQATRCLSPLSRSTGSTSEQIFFASGQRL